MRIALNVRSGPSVGRRLLLRSGQGAKFGRSEWSDFAFPEDTSMSEQHFQINCDEMGAVIASHPKVTTIVNGQPISEPRRLVNGDVIQAGGSVLQVSIDGDVSDQHSAESDGSAPEQAAEPQIDLTERAVYFGLSEQAQELAATCSDPDSFAESLINVGLLKDAIRWYAHILPKPKAVQWAIHCSQDLQQASPLSPAQAQAIRYATEWTAEPSEEKRKSADDAANAVKFQGIGGALAAAAAWSGGSLVPEDLEPVEPDERQTARAVYASFMLSCYVPGSIGNSAERMKAYLDAVRETAN